MKKIFLWGVFFTLIFASTAFAAPINITGISYGTNNSATISTTHYPSVTAYTEYYLATTPLGFLDAFCVEETDAATGLADLQSVPSSLGAAAWVAGQYYTNSNWAYNKEDTQLIIWALSLPDFAYISGGTFASDAALDTAILALGIPDDPSVTTVSLLHTPVSGQTLNTQDFLVGVSVPEPTTLLLLGFGLIGLAGIRKKIG